MFDNPQFAKLVDTGAATGEVVGANRFMVNVHGLGEINVGAVVRFADGGVGIVRDVHPERVTVFNLSQENTPLGTLVAVAAPHITTPVGTQLVGRIVSPLLEPLDGKGAVAVDAERPVFNEAPGIIEREELSEQLVTGVSIVDMLFPIVLGQRMAILGDNKSGKTTFLAQLAQTQAQHERVIVNVLIGKRKADTDRLIDRLTENGALKQSVIVAAGVFAPITQIYLAPYVGAAIAEYFWQQGKDVVVIYDDLTNHAKVYRELSLLAGVTPGRDSYPGDMFYAHSSLLERAGKLKRNHASLTALPVVSTPNEDITAYLPTNTMSITDGQIIFDQASFRKGIRPAVNVGLSVSRVGGQAQTPERNALTGKLFRTLQRYREATAFAQFSSELSVESQASLRLGSDLYEVFKQLPQETYPLQLQELLVEAVLAGAGERDLDVSVMKEQVGELAKKFTKPDQLPQAVSALLEAGVAP